jgi:predicted transposase/invertase (TIGR01784 family)
MITDPIFYRLFATSPETFFLLLGMSTELAQAMAARYEYQALEFKETSHRADGVFLPKEPGLPLYFLEVQFYRSNAVYADLLVKAYTYLKQNEPSQPFCGVVLFADRSLEPEGLAPYQPLLDAGLVRRFYLDELPELGNAPLGLSILFLIGLIESEAPTAANNLIARVRTEVDDAVLQADLVRLIETVIFYKFPHKTREELQAMLKIEDIRESHIWQEARAEGRKEGVEQGIQIAYAIAKLAAKNKSAAEIAATLKLDIETVNKALTEAEAP